MKKDGRRLGAKTGILSALICMVLAGGAVPVYADLFTDADTIQYVEVRGDAQDISRFYTDGTGTTTAGTPKPGEFQITPVAEILTLPKAHNETTGAEQYQGYEVRIRYDAKASSQYAGIYKASVFQVITVYYVDTTGNVSSIVHNRSQSSQIFYVGNGEELSSYFVISTTQNPIAEGGKRPIKVEVGTCQIGNLSTSKLHKIADLGTSGSSTGNATQDQIDDLEDKKQEIADAKEKIAEYEETEQQLLEENGQILDDLDLEENLNDMTDQSKPLFLTGVWVRDRYREMIGGTPLETALLISLSFGLALYIIGRLR